MEALQKIAMIKSLMIREVSLITLEFLIPENMRLLK